MCWNIYQTFFFEIDVFFPHPFVQLRSVLRKVHAHILFYFNCIHNFLKLQIEKVALHHANDFTEFRFAMKFAWTKFCVCYSVGFSVLVLVIFSQTFHFVSWTPRAFLLRAKYCYVHKYINMISNKKKWMSNIWMQQPEWAKHEWKRIQVSRIFLIDYRYEKKNFSIFFSSMCFYE